MLASQYLEDKGKLCKKIDMCIELLYFTHEEAREIMKEVHGWEWGLHMSSRMLAKKVGLDTTGPL